MMREDEFHEFKKTTGELNEAMVSISAMLNKNRRGQLFFGLKNDGSPFKFTITDSTLRDVSRKVFESIRPQLIPTIHIQDIGGVDVIVVDFSGDDVPYSAFGRYYIRTADEDRELSPAELRKIMVGREYEDNWGDRTSGETIDDADDETVKAFHEAAMSCGRMPVTAYDKRSVLQQVGTLNGEHLTNAGSRLFSSHSPIVLKMSIFATERKETFLDLSRVEGNIFQLIDAAVKYLVRNIRWRVESEGDGIHRREIPEVPLDAIREAVVNGFAHARYDLPVQHEIDIFSNRISICSPGTFANEFEPVDFYTRNLPSHLRNETIARVLYLCKDVETFGTGIKKIYTLCAAANVSVSYSKNDTSFTLEFSRTDRNSHHGNPGLVGEANGVTDGTTTGEMGNEPLGRITDGEIEILYILKEVPTITNAELARRTGRSERTIARMLALLKNKNLIERVGSRKTGYWKVF